MKKLHKNWITTVLFLSLMIWGFLIVEKDEEKYDNQVVTLLGGQDYTKTYENSIEPRDNTIVDYIQIQCYSQCLINFTLQDETRILYNETIVNRVSLTHGRFYTIYHGNHSWIPKDDGMYMISIENLNSSATNLEVSLRFVNYYSEHAIIWPAYLAFALYLLLPKIFGDPRRLVETEHKFFAPIYLTSVASLTLLIWRFALTLSDNSLYSPSIEDRDVLLVILIPIIMLPEGIFTYSIHSKGKELLNSIMVVALLAIPTIVIWGPMLDPDVSSDLLFMLVIYLFFAVIIVFPSVLISSVILGAIFKGKIPKHLIENQHQKENDNLEPGGTNHE